MAGELHAPVSGKKKRLTYLRSYNETSVGLMQVNERVWRGIYDQHQLRWNIAYNAHAGVEILALYWRKYAVPQKDRIKAFGEAVFAGLVYALYNGGPRHASEYPQRLEKGKLYLSDRLYNEKFAWVTGQQWENIDKCLIGG